MKTKTDPTTEGTETGQADAMSADVRAAHEIHTLAMMLFERLATPDREPDPWKAPMSNVAFGPFPAPQPGFSPSLGAHGAHLLFPWGGVLPPCFHG